MFFRGGRQPGARNFFTLPFHTQVRALPRRRWQRAVWLFCEEPDSSLAARVFAVVSVVCILISITNFCTETLPTFERALCVNVSTDGGRTFHERPNYSDPFFVVETVCVVWSVTFCLLVVITIVRVIVSAPSLAVRPVVWNYGLFAPLPFRPLDDSPPGSFAPWLIRPRTVVDSPPGLFAPVRGVIAIRRQKLYAYNLLL